MLTIFSVAICSLVSAGVESSDIAPTAKIIPVGVIDQNLVHYGYSGKEFLKYDVSWSGGIKIGELHLEMNAIDGVDDGFEIRAFITTKGGAVHLFYPISDLHVTKVQGLDKLPYLYEVWQDEGYSYTAHRYIEFDQEKYSVRYTKDDELKAEYQLDGPVNNEFSSFFNSRLMTFVKDKPFLVPTFADKKRVEVAVHPIEITTLEGTILGDVAAAKIMPVMKFKGLYDKKGDTVIWYTNDKCRVPVKINSKIAIGSLTARLTEYQNPSCDIYLPSGSDDAVETVTIGEQ
ncbi:DUF3108 domain-containing protein [Desulforhopalus sp. 52FAK]